MGAFLVVWFITLGATIHMHEERLSNTSADQEKLQKVDYLKNYEGDFNDGEREEDQDQ